MATENKEPTKEELEKAQAEADAQFEALLNTPITKEEAELKLADNDVKKMQLMIVRQKWQAQITQTQLNIAALDEQMLALDMERAMIFRRSLNKEAGVEQVPEMKIVGDKRWHVVPPISASGPWNHPRRDTSSRRGFPLSRRSSRTTRPDSPTGAGTRSPARCAAPCRTW